VPKYTKTPEEVDFLRQALQHNYLFMDLTENNLAELVDAMEPHVAEAGTKIIQQGDTGDYFYIVQSGQVDFVKQSPGKPAESVGSCQAGESFGELALLYDAPRAASCIAASKVKLWRIDQTMFRYMMAHQDHVHNKQVKDWIQKVPVFRDLHPVDLARFVQALSPVNWKEGTRIVQKGEEGLIFYIIQTGNVRVHDIGLGDSNSEELILGPGDYFGERALLTGEPRAATCTALTNVTTLAVDRGTFESCIGPLKNLLEREMRKRSLKALPMFSSSNITEPEYDQLVNLMREVCYPKGTILAEIGKPYPPNLWLIRHGRVVVTHEDNTNIYNLQTGDYFGDKSLKGDPNHLSSHHATVDENLTTCILTKDDIESVLGDIERLGNTKVLSTSKQRSQIPFEALTRHGLLGRGAFASVWLVSYRGTDNITSAFALKAMKKARVIDAKMTMAIIREKKMLSLLEHPFIVHLVASYQDDENLYLLLPLIPGGELYNVLLRESVFSNEKAAFYGACIVEAIGYFHQRHIAYRDLKLENIMIDESGMELFSPS
jgi:CRP-like cAMP-binding protein